MNKSTTRMFTILGIIATACKVSALAIYYFFDWNIVYTVLDWGAQLLLSVLFLFVARDLHKNYNKKGWPVYLFIISRLLYLFLSSVLHYPITQLLLLGIISFLIGINLCFFLVRTKYRLFAFIFMFVLILSAFTPVLHRYFSSFEMQWFYRILSLVQIAYPLLLVYIVRISEYDNSKEMIESIGKKEFE